MANNGKMGDFVINGRTKVRFYNTLIKLANISSMSSEMKHLNNSFLVLPNKVLI